MKSSHLVFLAVLLLAAACGDDGSKQGVRELCAAPGAAQNCAGSTLTTAEDLCWRLVECGAIPIERPPEDDSVFDWSRCVGFTNGLDDFQFEFSLACVEASTCDELKTNNAPNSPRSVPLCLRHGDQ